jgi:hypothetical protein
LKLTLEVIQVSIKFWILKTTGVMLLTKHMYTGKKVSDFGTRIVLQAAKMGRGRQMYAKSAHILPRVPTSF